MELLFYISAILCVYSYFLYPVLLKLLPSRVSYEAAVDEDAQLPNLSLIITVHNEESRIRGKLENTLQIDYPPGLLEIIVASDFSTDETKFQS